MPGGNLAPADLDNAGSCAGHVLACTFDFTAGISEHTLLLLHVFDSSMSCLQARAAPKKAAPAPKAAAFAPAKPPVSATAAAVPKCVACSPYTHLATTRIVATINGSFMMLGTLATSTTCFALACEVAALLATTVHASACNVRARDLMQILTMWSWL